MENKVKLEQLTGLRCFAALLVFLSHLNWDGSSIYLKKIFESGFVGVSFFFLLSGFILSYSYKEKILNHSLSFKKYALLRLARLSPLHLLTTLPFVLYALYKINLNYLKLVLNIFFLQSWVPSDSYYFSFNAPSWSLSNEIFFYFCFFPLVLLRPKILLNIFISLLTTISLGAFFVDFFIQDKNFLAAWQLLIGFFIFSLYQGC